MRILIAEDMDVSRRMLETLLKEWGYEVVVVEDGAEAWKVLQSRDAPRLALLDWMMPGMDGLEVCRRVRKRSGGPYTYILLLTAKGSKKDIVEGLESGADDYLTKPFHPDELRARVRVGKRILELEDNLVATRDVLHFKANHDLLTGLWNREAVLDILQRELPRARREGRSLGLLLVDVDHLKSINGLHGNRAGDEVLQEVARRLSGAVRFYDAVGRYGGEEFLIVMPGCDSSTARTRAEHLHAAMNNQLVKTAKGEVGVTLSVAVVSSADWGEADSSELLRAADAALYRAKAEGCNCVEWAAPAEAPAAARATGGDRGAEEAAKD